MAGLRWTAVLLTVFLCAGGGRAAVDQSWLTGIVEGIKKEYALGDGFSLAVNVPEMQDISTLQQVFQEDPAAKVKQTLSKGQVYQGTCVVAAAQPGAMARVLQSMQTLVSGSPGNFLVIYSEELPCCPTNAADIADKVNDVARKWSGYAFVFSKVDDVPDADASQLAESFKWLPVSRLGLANIFRCYKPGDDPFQCTGCSSGGGVTPLCVAGDSPENTEQGGGDEEGNEQEIAPGGETGGGGEMGGGGGSAMATGKSELTGGGKGTGEGKVGKQSKPRGGGKRGKGSKVRKQSKRKGGGKGSKVRKQSKSRGSGKGSKVRKQSKPTGGGKRGKGSKVRKQSKRKGGGKGSKVRKQSKSRGSGKGSKVRKQNKPRGGGKRGKGGKKWKGRG